MYSKIFATCVLLMALNGFASAEVGKWMVSKGNITCLIVQMEFSVNFTYVDTDNKTKSVDYKIPVNETTMDNDGSQCSDGVDTLKVSWPEGNNFLMQFELNKTSNPFFYDLSSIVINFNTSSLFNDSSANQTVKVSYQNLNVFDKQPNFSYHCNRVQILNATNGSISVSKVQYEAFKTDNSKKFSNAKDCDSNISPDIVPIAVGISLIALIVVVLIAYIVGRRRQQARGYLNIM